MISQKNQSSELLAKQSEELELQSIQENLKLSYEQRIEAHEKARVLLEDLKKAGEDLRAKSQKST